MTLTEAPPNESAPPTHTTESSRTAWVTSSHHRHVGALYLMSSVVFAVVAGTVAFAYELERSRVGVTIVGDSVAQYWNVWSTSLSILFLAPAWLGLAIAIVPAQVGAKSLAFGRLANASWWFTMAGSLTWLLGFLLSPLASVLFDKQVDGVRAAGLVFPQPMEAGLDGGNAATDLALGGLTIVAIGLIMGWASVVATVLARRIDGMRFARVPFFSVAALMTGVVWILGVGAHLGGMFLLQLDQHSAGSFFASTTDGTKGIYQHLLWWNGRPESLVLLVLAFGAVCDIVVTATKRQLVFPRLAQALICAAALGTLLIFTSKLSAFTSVYAPLGEPAAAFYLVPRAVLAIMIVTTLALGARTISLPLIASFAMLATLMHGAIHALLSLRANLEGPAFTDPAAINSQVTSIVGSTWPIANSLNLTVFAPLLGLVAAVCYWAPKLWGRSLSRPLALAVLTCAFGGTFVVALGQYILGYEYGPAYIADSPSRFGAAFGAVRADGSSVAPDLTFENLSMVTAIGWAFVVVALALFVAAVLLALKGVGREPGKNPVDGSTLEWNFDSPLSSADVSTVPPVLNARPLADLAEVTP